ncbi:YqgE/AlgH family protein [Desulfobacterales bacterium HSG2]|nr:YqgE/AlgH family protein [Desulfobacterales bacterium HSG2]
MENEYFPSDQHQVRTSLKGQFLMAMPGLADPNFAFTVTCICEHAPEGAVGIIVNQVHAFLSGKDIFDELKIRYKPGSEFIPIHLGGPVHIDEIFVLHGPPFGWRGCLMVTPFLAMSNTRDILEAIAMGEGPKSLMIALGCAGWGPAQLESEIRQNAWLTSPASENVLFNTPVEARWEEALRNMGIEPALLSDTAGHA